MSSSLLVTGASGPLGRRVVAHVLDTHGVAPARLIAGTRDPGKLADLAARGVEVRRIDFEDPSSLSSGLARVDRMLLISTDAIDRPGRRLAQHTAAIAAARAAGVRHVVYTSMPRPDDSELPIAPDHLGTERALEASGVVWTILRNTWYMENLLHSLPAALASGTWYSSAGSGRVAYVAREDCARVAAAALVSSDARPARYDIAGPALLTVEEIAAIVSRTLGVSLEVAHVTDEQLAAGMRAAGVPEPLVPFWVAFETNTRAGKVDISSDAVARLTGVPPQRLEDFVREHATAFTATLPSPTQ